MITQEMFENSVCLRQYATQMGPQRDKWCDETIAWLNEAPWSDDQWLFAMLMAMPPCKVVVVHDDSTEEEKVAAERSNFFRRIDITETSAVGSVSIEIYCCPLEE